MTNLIAPPPELVRQWIPAGWDCSSNTFITLLMRIATQSAQWAWDKRGAINEAELQKARDEELEACLKFLHWQYLSRAAEILQAARRPKPPSMKEQALKQLDSLHADLKTHGLGTNTDTIRRALEALDD